jgi:hypothetical protein
MVSIDIDTASGYMKFLLKKKKPALIILLSAAAAVSLFLVGPIPQDTTYHLFADGREIFGIPHFLNVVSNIPFIITGILGLNYLIKVREEGVKESFSHPVDTVYYIIFFSGILLTGIGSSYYHIRTDNQGLFWDRLPMTIGFISFFTAVVNENISVKSAKILFIPLLFFGAASVIYWYLGENGGGGDLRPYILVQYFPVVLIPLIIFMFTSRYTRSCDFIFVILIYALAKVFEIYDSEIYSAGEIISGHTVKHLVAAYAAYFVLRMLKLRAPVS